MAFIKGDTSNDLSIVTHNVLISDSGTPVNDPLKQMLIPLKIASRARQTNNT